MCPLRPLIKIEVRLGDIIKREKPDIKYLKRPIYFFRTEKTKCFMREEMVLETNI